MFLKRGPCPLSPLESFENMPMTPCGIQRLCPSPNSVDSALPHATFLSLVQRKGADFRPGCILFCGLNPTIYHVRHIRPPALSRRIRLPIFLLAGNLRPPTGEDACVLAVSGQRSLNQRSPRMIRRSPFLCETRLHLHARVSRQHGCVNETGLGASAISPRDSGLTASRVHFNRFIGTASSKRRLARSHWAH